MKHQGASNLLTISMLYNANRLQFSISYLFHRASNQLSIVVIATYPLILIFQGISIMSRYRESNRKVSAFSPITICIILNAAILQLTRWLYNLTHGVSVSEDVHIPHHNVCCVLGGLGVLAWQPCHCTSECELSLIMFDMKGIFYLMILQYQSNTSLFFSTTNTHN
jgi:hypothetical protein